MIRSHSKLILVKENQSFKQIGIWHDINNVTEGNEEDINVSIHGALITKEFLLSRAYIESDPNRLSKIRTNQPIGPLFFTNRGTISKTIYEPLGLKQEQMFDIESSKNISSLILGTFNPRLYACKLLYFKVADMRTDSLIDVSQIEDGDLEEEFVPSITETSNLYNSLT